MRTPWNLIASTAASLIFLLLSSLTLLPAQAASPRERISFNADWLFQKGDPDGTGDRLGYGKTKAWMLPSGNAFRTKKAEFPSDSIFVPSYADTALDDKNWRKLNLPHDWGIEGAFQQSLPGETGKLPWFGVAWYRKHFELPLSDKGRRIRLEVDGAMSFSTVWCNGKFVGGWPYGYSSWQLDLTPYVNFGGPNTLAIRLDNPTDSSRWYPGGGIYRNVWLLKTGPIHVAQWGTTITTPRIDPASATVKIDTRLDNDSAEQAEIQVLTEIFRIDDSTGVPAGVPEAKSSTAATTVQAGESATMASDIILEQPKLWSPDAPHLYAAVTRLTRNDQLIDTYETIFGVREAKFTAHDGFHLNGKRLPIRGVCQHHDLGALGAAFNTRAAERQIEILKEMGVNAIRTSHNPPAPEFLALCDRMGILVMDEFADCWKLSKTANGYNLLFEDWSEADVRSFIRRDRNHPSVILWSIGNEINEQSKPEGPEMGKALSKIVHEEDPTRPTTIGCSAKEGGYNGFQTTVDVFGYNYKPGEYKKFHETHPEIPLIGSETSSTVSSRAEYLFPVSNNKDGGKIGFQMSSYDLYAPSWAQPPEWEFKGQDQNPNVAGEFVWTGFDYLGEPTPFNSDMTNLLNYHTPEAKAKAEEELKALGKIKVPSRSSYFGIVDLAGFKKDRFYLYQARWRPDLPMVHILPHWNWPERAGQVTPVHLYTSGDEAELFLNGKSLGKKKKQEFEYRLRWDDVVYEPGTLEAVAYKNGKEWAKTAVATTGPAAKLLLQADATTVKSDGQDLSFVTVTLADTEERLVPRSPNLVHFEVDGPGELVATDNGDPTDHTSFQSPDRRVFNGLALAIVRARRDASGHIVLRATSEGIQPAEISIQAKP